MITASTAESDVRVLILEDTPSDAELMRWELARSGLKCVTRRVESEPTLRAALDEFEPDVILVDYSLPRFDGMRALMVVQDLGLDVPVILVSGAVSEDTALEWLHMGAADDLLKDNLPRLGSAIKGALEYTLGARGETHSTAEQHPPRQLGT